MRPSIEIVTVDSAIAKKAEQQIESCEHCHPADAEIPFDWLFGINSPREPFAQETVHRRKPGALHHLAFKVESKDEVDRLAAELARIGANIVDGPVLFPQHGSDYYAVFFKDPDGIKYEIVCSGA